MPRARLVHALEQLPKLTPPACFVLLWTFFEEVGLGPLEDRLRAEGLKPYQLRHRLADTAAKPFEPRRRLAKHVGSPVDFDRFAIEWLIRLDRGLNDGPSARFEPFELRGVDGATYRVRRRNNLIANHFEAEPTWAAHQGRSLLAYACNHLVVPVQPPGGFELRCLGEPAWGNRVSRAGLLHAKETAGLKILLWPLRCRLDYLGLDLSRPLPAFVSLREVSNEAELVDDVCEAIATARRELATILVFPELAIPPVAEAAVVRALAEEPVEHNPVLTLVGRCHRPSEEPELDVNEAVLLASDGRELHRHRKLVCFTDRTADCGERLATGNTVTVLESSIGNLVPLICLDLIDVPIRDLLARSHGNLLLVPSLSKKTTAHSDTAKDLQVRRLASSFVVNRWLDHLWQPGQPPMMRPEDGGSSFFQVPSRKRAKVAHFCEQRDRPYLLFSLGDAE